MLFVVAALIFRLDLVRVKVTFIPVNWKKGVAMKYYNCLETCFCASIFIVYGCISIEVRNSADAYGEYCCV